MRQVKKFLCNGSKKLVIIQITEKCLCSLLLNILSFLYSELRQKCKYKGAIQFLLK